SVFYAFGQFNVCGCITIVRVSASYNHTVGLKADGTVVAAGPGNALAAGPESGNVDWGQCRIKSWSGITAVSAGGMYTAGLKADGTVVVAGYDADELNDIKNRTDIKAY
ncbi:MAG: hypothetical protein LUD81_07970, partial [Clostridiales bacterium]|nr:hypothetical protein [Clostridiales bacterium]